MGTFAGHVIPGTFFALFALWWISQVARRRLLCNQKKLPYFNTATFPVPLGRLPRYPAEGVAKMLAAAVGMSCELFASLGYGQGQLESMGDIEHFTMYSFFLLSGVVDCLVYRGSKTLPEGSDYGALVLAFAAEWVLFRHHLDGRPALDVEVHTFLLYAISACTLVTALEYKYDNSELAVWIRSYCTLIQGTWFYQIGFILYPPHPSLRHWEDNDPDQLMLAAIIFAWHCLVDAVVITFLYLVITRCYRRHCRLFDFHVEQQLVAQGESLQSMRLKKRQRKHEGHVYMELGETDDVDNTLVDVTDEETPLT